MRLPRFLSMAIFITGFSLLYVYQQTEIFRLAYVGQKKRVSYEDLLDKNTILRYNIKTRASLVHIGSKVSETCDFQMPDSYVLVKLNPSHEGLVSSKQAVNRETLLSRLFGIKRQAEAKTINP